MTLLVVRAYFLMSSPTQRTLAKLRKMGYKAQVVEKWIPQARRRQDLFGFIDVVGINEDSNGVLGIQATTGSNVGKRLKKLRETPDIRQAMLVWLAAGNSLEVWGWRKLKQKKKDGTYSKRVKWKPLIKKISLESLRQWEPSLVKQIELKDGCSNEQD